MEIVTSTNWIFTRFHPRIANPLYFHSHR